MQMEVRPRHFFEKPIHGYVYDMRDYRPIEGATVKITNATWLPPWFDKTVVTDWEGRWDAEVPFTALRANITYSHPNYKTKKTNVEVHKDAEFRVYLEPKEEDKKSLLIPAIIIGAIGVFILSRR